MSAAKAGRSFPCRCQEVATGGCKRRVLIIGDKVRIWCTLLDIDQTVSALSVNTCDRRGRVFVGNWSILINERRVAEFNNKLKEAKHLALFNSQSFKVYGIKPDSEK